MNDTTKQIAKVEDINDSNVRLHFTDGTTLRMSRKAYESGSWKQAHRTPTIR